MCSLFGYKQTILLLYLRIFGVNRIFTRCTWVVMFIVFGYLFCDFWTQLFGCIPPAKFWNPDLPGHCFNFRAVDLAYSFINIISDFLIMLLPLPMIWRLQLKWKGKVGISLVFLSGAMYVERIYLTRRLRVLNLHVSVHKLIFRPSACAVATVRVTYVIRDLYSADRSWDAGRSFLWRSLCPSFPNQSPLEEMLRVSNRLLTSHLVAYWRSIPVSSAAACQLSNPFPSISYRDPSSSATPPDSGPPNRSEATHQQPKGNWPQWIKSWVYKISYDISRIYEKLQLA